MTYRSLEGCVALVTGASSGVGRATTLALAREGAEIFAAARREDLLHELADESPCIRAVPLDATDRKAVDRVIARLREERDRLDILVCAAGLNIPRRGLDELTIEDWRKVMEVNATATFNVIQASLPLLRRAQGLAIVIASVSARWPDTSGIAYQASKRAVLGIAHAVSLEERDHGVRASAILPGVIDTPLLDSRPEPPPPERRALALKAEDVAEVCLFLARLHPRVFIPELVVMPSAVQRIGYTYSG